MIGRGDGVDILLEDIKVSRRHATVELADGRVLLTDAGSTNGTWLNDERIADAHQLRDGDRIRVGHVQLRFFDPAAAPTDPVGRIDYTLVRPALATEAAPRPTSGALAGPTQAMNPRRRPARMLLMIGSCVALLSWMAWAFLVL